MDAGSGTQVMGGFSKAPSQTGSLDLNSLLGGFGREEDEQQKMLLQLLGQAKPQALDANFNTSNLSVGGLR